MEGCGERWQRIGRERSDARSVNSGIHEFTDRRDEGHLLRRAQPRKKSEFVLAALRFAPVPMYGRNECLGVLNG
jgi:hypothetical protein